VKTNTLCRLQGVQQFPLPTATHRTPARLAAKRALLPYKKRVIKHTSSLKRVKKSTKEEKNHKTQVQIRADPAAEGKRQGSRSPRQAAIASGGGGKLPRLPPLRAGLRGEGGRGARPPAAENCG